jgi:hypothetical protein
MDKTLIIRKLVEHMGKDFVSYFDGTPQLKTAKLLIELSITGDPNISSKRDEIESIIPDTEDDGNWECSYALNTGGMILSLIDYMFNKDEIKYSEAVALFFDTVDFKVQEDLEKNGVPHPTEEQIRSHPIYVREQAWFINISANA